MRASQSFPKHCKLFLLSILAVAPIAGEASADTIKRIEEKEEFVDSVVGKELRLRMLGIQLIVHEDGEITGKALGWPVQGNWHWKNGYFCREMDWSGTEVPYNCQLVEVLNNEEVRFTVDQGKGDSATFRVR